MNWFDGSLKLLQKGLDVAWKRNEVIGNNISNADTPGFKASRVEFEELLKNQMGEGTGIGMKSSHYKSIGADSHIDSIEPQIIQKTNISMNNDGNNVDVENEMAELAKNTLLYQTLIQKATKEIGKMKYVISEGKR